MKRLVFDIALAQTKPESIRQRDAVCPFCDPSALTDILATSGPIIWLMNKYPVLSDAWQTVIIETAPEDHREYSQLSLEEATHILDFSLEKWEEVKASSEFASVLFFKNFGPMSGGSIYHQHSQIVGLRNYDYREDIKPHHFQGWTLHEETDLSITLSQEPLVGFFEFNMQFPPSVSRRTLAMRVQQVLRYLLTEFSKFTPSYNLFFYDLQDDHYYLKLVPRYVTSPLFIGYQIPQVCNQERAQHIRHILQSYLS